MCTLTLTFLEALQQKCHSKEKPFQFQIDDSDVSHTLLSEVAEIQKWTEEINQLRFREREEKGDPEGEVAEEKDPNYSLLADDSSGTSVISPTDSDDPEKRKVSRASKKRKASPAHDDTPKKKQKNRGEKGAER